MLFRRAAKAQDRRLLLRLPPAEITLERASALEIDDVLEENAEDFVRAYVQKGGQ